MRGRGGGGGKHSNLYLQVPHPRIQPIARPVSTEYIQTFLAIIPPTIQYNNYLHKIYIVLGVISNLEII